MAALFCLAAAAAAQDSGQSPSLGDVARKARQQRASQDRVPAKHILDDDSQSAHGPTWTVHACKQMPCSFLSITLPPNAKQNQTWAGPGAAVVPLKEDDDRTHVIRVYGADLLEAYDLESAKHLFLQDWFSRPYFFGRSAKYQFDDHMNIDGYPAVRTHFTVTNRMLTYRGLAILAVSPAGTFGFACVFRDEDSGDATSTCEGILNSAAIEVPNRLRSAPPPADPDPDDDPPQCSECRNENPD